MPQKKIKKEGLSIFSLFSEYRIKADDGADLAVWDSKGRGPPVVFVHGFPENHWSWEGLIKALSAKGGLKHRYILYDLRGHGESDKKGEATLNNYYEDHQAIVRALQLPPYHLVGHDWGGALALHVARYDRPSVISISVMNTNYWKTSLFGMGHLVFFNIPVLPSLAFHLIPSGVFLGAFKKTFIHPENLSSNALTSYLMALRDPEATSYWTKLYRNLAGNLALRLLPLNWLGRFTAQKLIPSKHAFQCPVSLIWGEKDFFNPVSVGKDILQHLLKEKGEVQWNLVSDAGHFVHEDQPFVVAPILWEHWRRSERAGSSRVDRVD